MRPCPFTLSSFTALVVIFNGTKSMALPVMVALDYFTLYPYYLIVYVLQVAPLKYRFILLIVPKKILLEKNTIYAELYIVFVILK